jgi:hypothetical protein
MSAWGIQEALDDWLSAYQEANPQFELALENTAFTPTKGIMFLASVTSGRNRRPLGVGPNAVTEYSGFYQININGPVDEGVQPLVGAGDALATYFGRGTVLVSSDLTRVVIEISSVQSAIINGDWVTVPVTVQWFSTEP